ncbi:MAG: sensor histidine kinase, partial [Gammaproteobacteria bacterium]|nr:sensor histidine kinase [Gammaproteobacteria bacterium]
MHFADILASLIHDMKNSLWLVINTLEAITAEPLPGAETDKVFTLQQEAKRLNTNLIELLTL